MSGVSTLSVASDAPPIESVYISDQLNRRRSRRVSYRRQLAALQDLADRLVTMPKAVLPRFVELAMELTGGSSAGLSIFEPADDGAGVFRWHHLSGKLKPLDGATTPRDDSPCGVTLDRNRPTLASHPERAYDWIAAEGLVIPEVLLVPLRIGSDEPLGTLWIISETSGHFRRQDSDLATELARFVGMALYRIRIEEQLRAAIAEQELLAREMSHRVKNVYALTESMVRMTAREAKSTAAMAEAISGRLRALANAHSLVRRNVGADADNDPIELAELLHIVVKPQELDSRAKRITIAGPAVSCGPHSANGLALIFHELTTNAVKYGALSRAGGRVSIKWRRDGEMLTICWRETGGPAIDSAPDSFGFGTTLSKRMIERQFDGSLDQQWPPEGLVWTMTVKVARLAE
jgi:two-component sensor histidine kinase